MRTTASSPDADRSGRTRFVWRTDRDGRLVEVSPPFWPRLRAPIHITGRPFPAILKDAGTDGQGQLVAALATQTTFNGVHLQWPDGSGDGWTAIEFGASPRFDAARRFDGFRGFGTVQASSVPIAPATAGTGGTPDKAATHTIVIGGPSRPDAGGTPRDDGEGQAGEKSQASQCEASPADAAATVPAADTDGPPVTTHDGSPPSVAAAKPLAVLPNDSGSELSASERSAFDEIARALGHAPQAFVPDAAIDDPRQGPGPEPMPVPEPLLVPVVGGADDVSLARLVDLVPIGILVCRDGTPLFANRTLLDLTGFVDIEAMHEEGGLDRLLGSPVAGNSDETVAVLLHARDGDATPVDVRSRTIEWRDGQAATLFSIRRAAVDETAVARREALERSLRDSESETRELHTILDTATDGVVILDSAGNVLSLNRSAEALFGLESHDVAGKPFAALVADDSRANLIGYLAGLREGGVASVLNDGREIQFRAPRGGVIPVFITVGRLGVEDVPKFCAVLRDITAWKNAERTLDTARADAERASAQKSEFLARISHEVRTPLNAILGFAEVMMDERFGPVGSERYREYLKDIHRSGEHVMSLVNDLLDLSKIEAGKMDMTFTSVDANAAVSDCVSLMQPQAGSARIVIRTSLAPRLPKIIADERAFKQIVLNILSNALKYNEAGGQVIVSTARTDGGHAVLRIRDTGLGMTDSEVQVALQPFSQLSTSRASMGTGLGLPLTKALAEAIRANFSIKSRKGDGTLVEIAFPPSRVMAE